MIVRVSITKLKVKRTHQGIKQYEEETVKEGGHRDRHTKLLIMEL